MFCAFACVCMCAAADSKTTSIGLVLCPKAPRRSQSRSRLRIVCLDCNQNCVPRVKLSKDGGVQMCPTQLLLADLPGILAMHFTNCEAHVTSCPQSANDFTLAFCG